MDKHFERALCFNDKDPIAELEVFQRSVVSLRLGLTKSLYECCASYICVDHGSQIAGIMAKY